MEKKEKEKSNLEIFLMAVGQAIYLIWMVYDWGHKNGLKVGVELGKVEATAGKKPPVTPIKTEK